MRSWATGNATTTGTRTGGGTKAKTTAVEAKTGNFGGDGDGDGSGVVKAPRTPSFNFHAVDGHPTLAAMPAIDDDKLGVVDEDYRDRLGTLLSIDDLVAEVRVCLRAPALRPCVRACVRGATSLLVVSLTYSFTHSLTYSPVSYTHLTLPTIYSV